MQDDAPQAAGNALPLSPEEEAALAEDVELDIDMRRRVLLLARDLDQLDYYALLGADIAADKKALKRAYYDLAARFHPDRYFRKKLGTYKVRMEAIFARVTLAHDTLTDGDRRAEYDAYIEEQRRSRGIEQKLAAAMAEARRAEETVERDVRVQQAEAAAGSTPAPSPSRAPQPPSPRPPGPAVPLDARRDALARRLLGGRPLPPPSRPAATVSTGPATPAPSGAPPTPPTPLTPAAADAVQALRRRYEERVTQAKVAQARKYVASGEAALAAGDVVSAATAFRVARSLSPGDRDLEQRALDAQARAGAVLAETYTKQAQYEEKNGQWAEAARSWRRVCSVRGEDARAHERAANAIVKAGGDLHEAARLAQHACELAPQSARHRLTLAGVYTAAGLPLRARRELETAAQLAPHDGTIQAMLRSAGKPA